MSGRSGTCWFKSSISIAGDVNKQNVFYKTQNKQKILILLVNVSVKGNTGWTNPDKNPNGSNMIIMKFDICLHIKEGILLFWRQNIWIIYVASSCMYEEKWSINRIMLWCLLWQHRFGMPKSVRVSSESVSVFFFLTKLGFQGVNNFSFHLQRRLLDIVLQQLNSLTPAGAARCTSPLTAETVDLHTCPHVFRSAWDETTPDVKNVETMLRFFHESD